jgi:hypothetical protein
MTEIAIRLEFIRRRIGKFIIRIDKYLKKTDT